MGSLCTLPSATCLESDRMTEKKQRFEPVCLTSFLSPKVYSLKSLALRLFPKVKIKETFICLFFFFFSV